MGDPGGPGWPFLPGGFDLSQVMRMLQSEGPVNWEVAGQIAGWVSVTDPSGETRSDDVPDAVASAHLEELVRAAQTHVAGATGLAEVLAAPVRSLTRREWADLTLQGLRPVVEALAGSLRPDQPQAGPPGAGAAAGLHPSAADPFGGLMAMLAPVLLGIQTGTMIGLLAQQALGRYDLPLPLDGEPLLGFVPANVDEFATAWSLAADDLRFALALRETVRAAERSVPWVRRRLVELSKAYVSAYRLDEDALEEYISGIDLSDPAALTEQTIDPAKLLDTMRTPEQAAPLDELQRFAAVLEGYADTVVDRVGASLVPSFGQIDEALRRHRVDRGQAVSLLDRMLGLEMRREHYELGVTFCRGVVERAGPDGLNRVWEREVMVPTRAELEAPGLWLARIEFDG